MSAFFVICRVLLLLSTCLVLYLVMKGHNQHYGLHLVGSVWEGTILELYQGLTHHKQPLYGLDFILEYNISTENKARQKRVSSTPPNQTLGHDCDRTVILDRIETYSSHQAGLFMIESSGRNTLTARQACAVESAVLQSGMQVILVVMASNLDLRDNTTCYLYMKSNKVKIFSLDIQTFVENSPLESFFNSTKNLAASHHKAVHTSDALRLLLIYKYGGLYLDLDYVVLRDLSHYKNMLLEEGDGSSRGTIDLTNSAFMFTAHHPYLLAAMQGLEKRYQAGCWACIGPGLLTGTARKMTNVTMIKDIPASANLNVTLMKRLMPVHWTAAQGLLFPEKPVSFSRWERIFQNASTVHFFGYMTSGLVAHDDPQYSAYALLGPRYCPHAYYSTQYF